jgi:DNA polymerase I
MQPTLSAATERRLLIVDGHAYAYRAFYAIRQLSSPTGQATNAIYGFIKMLAKMLATLKPSHLIIVWDGGLAEERMALLPEYKVQRAEMPTSLEEQLGQIVDYLKAASISSYCQTGVEADDFIATLTRQAEAEGVRVVIASSDKDFMQLVSANVALFNPNDKTETLWGESQVRAKTCVGPSQIVDWLSLIGDSVDNIPGVPGVGPKTAADLLNQFQSVTGIYEHLAEVKSDRLRVNLQNSAELVRRNQQLIRLKDDLPCDFSMQLMAMKEGNFERLRELFSGWGFKTLLNELEQAQMKNTDLFSKTQNVS